MRGLTAQQLEFFHTEGYLHVPDALQAKDLDPVQAELEEIVDRAAKRLVAEGKIDRDFAELPFEKRLVPLGRADASAAAQINIPANLGKAIFDFLHNDRLLDLLESIIGPEIYANSCQHIRPTAARRTGPRRSAGAWTCAGTTPASPMAGRTCPGCWCAAVRPRNW